MNRELLTDDLLASALMMRPDWDVVDNKLRRSVTYATFLDAIDFVGQVAIVAEEMDHHPDIDIRWRTVHLATSTHDRGGVTEWDFELARRVDLLADHVPS